ncbi:hypothetical protein C8J57DRAFT_1310476, partial [Mycena rebaudengoi]
LASLVGVATLASALPGSYSEALRFGDFQVSPTTLAPGDSIAVTADFSCAVEKRNTPTFLDYYIELPSWFYFADAQYSVVLTNLFAWAGPTGEQVITSGGVIQPITITGI